MTAASPPDDFAALLRDVLSRRGISRKDFARKIGVSRNTVTSWTTGRYRPDHEHSERIAVALKMTLDELHGGTTARRAGRSRTPARPAAAPRDDEAQRIVRQLAALELEEPLEGIRRTTPQLLRVVAEARAHAG